MKRLWPILILLACCAVVQAAEFQEFPEFRYSSGLPGGGFGVDPMGNVGFDGALQMNIPVGYTPGADNYAMAISSASTSGDFPTDIDGNDVNGTVAIGFGLGRKLRVFIMNMGTGNGRGDISLETAGNVQVQLLSESPKYPAISVGIVDIFNDRTSSLTDPFAGDAFSVFVAATREAGTAEKPLYWTVGFGTGRFNDSPFGGVSWQPAPRWKVFAEYDGWNPNIGTAYSLIQSRQGWYSTLMLGLVDLERINVGISLTKTAF